MERGGGKVEESRGVGRGGEGRGARGVTVSAWQKCQHQTGMHTLGTQSQHTQPAHNTLWWTQRECALHTDQLTPGHIRMGTAPESTAQPLTALTTNYSLHPACMHTTQCSWSHDHTVGWAESGVACGSFGGDAAHSTHPLQSGCHKGGGDHLTPSALRRPRPPERTSTGGHPIGGQEKGRVDNRGEIARSIIATIYAGWRGWE